MGISVDFLSATAGRLTGPRTQRVLKALGQRRRRALAECERARVLQPGDQRAAHLGDQFALVAERVCNVGRHVDEAVGGATRAVQRDCSNRVVESEVERGGKGVVRRQC